MTDRNRPRAFAVLAFAMTMSASHAGTAQEKAPDTFRYEHRLRRLPESTAPLLSTFPKYIEEISPAVRFEAPPLIDEEDADLAVRCWRFSYNVRGVVEYANRLCAKRTAVIVVHPWGVDDGQGWRTPQPAGCAFQCTPERNQMCLQHAGDVIQPFLQRLRPHVGLVAYSLPGREDPVRGLLYRSVRRPAPTEQQRRDGLAELRSELAKFSYTGQAVPRQLKLSQATPLVDYFEQIPGLDAGPKYNGAGFWELPIPVMSPIQTAPEDVVFYDAEGYAILRDFLIEQGVRHVLLAGYNTDMCVCSTTAGYDNLRQDFNVFLVGDATLATSPANRTPAPATAAAVSFASLKVMITQSNWIECLPVSGDTP